jgi:hypothetical protein
MQRCRKGLRPSGPGRSADRRQAFVEVSDLILDRDLVGAGQALGGVEQLTDCVRVNCQCVGLGLEGFGSA